MLDMDQKTTNVAIQLAAKLKDSGSLAGRSPLSAAAASIFMAGHLMGVPKSAKEIANVVGVSDSTIRGAAVSGEGHSARRRNPCPRRQRREAT